MYGPHKRHRRETLNRGFEIGATIKLLLIRNCRKKATKDCSDMFELRILLLACTYFTATLLGLNRK
jgi:hypothetical protein